MNLGAVEPAAADWLWEFGALTAQTPPPPTPRQAAVSADDIGVITDQWAVVVGQVLAPKIAADYMAGWRAQQARVSAIVEAANLTEEQLAQFTLPLIDVQEAAQMAAADAANRLLGIGDELWGHARTSLTEGMAKGESVPKLAERVRQATGVSLPRATVIARTESMAARNAGAYDEMTTLAGLGIVESKTWLATHDARTRPTHVAADRQTVPFDAKFTVGGWPADRPHDPALPAEEAANCRCTLLYNLAGEEPVYPLASSLLKFHLPGQHNQATHGHSGGYLAAGDISSGADYDSLNQGIEHSGGFSYADRSLGAIQEAQGFDGKPKVVGRGEFDRAVAAGEVTETHRGFGGDDPHRYAEAYRSGELWPGTGGSGSGTYVAITPRYLEDFAPAAQLRIGLRKDAKVIDWDELQQQMRAYRPSSDAAREVNKDPGRFAALRGYDAIRHTYDVWGDDRDTEIVILNRTATIVQGA